MNKRNIVILGTVLILAIAVAGGFWAWRNNQMKNIDDLVWYEIPELEVRFKVTPDAKDDLGYNFKKYMSFENSINVKKVAIYSLSETDSNLSDCTLSEEKGWSCGLIDISIASKNEIDKYSERNPGFTYCNPGNLSVLENNYICITNIGNNIDYNKFVFNEEYQNFFHISQVKDKKFGIYFNTIDSIKQ